MITSYYVSCCLSLGRNARYTYIVGSDALAPLCSVFVMNLVIWVSYRLLLQYWCKHVTFICDTMPFLYIFLLLLIFISFQSVWNFVFNQGFVVCINMFFVEDKEQMHVQQGKRMGGLEQKWPTVIVLCGLLFQKRYADAIMKDIFQDSGTECKAYVVLPAIICSVFHFLPQVLRTILAWFRILWRNAVVYMTRPDFAVEIYSWLRC